MRARFGTLVTFSMPLRLHNTASGKKEEYRSAKAREVTMYTCGPTVYNVAHIGNLSSFLAADVLRRWLAASGYAVRHVMNITDVDDKTIRGAREAGKSLGEFTARYEALFRTDLERLNVLEPVFVHATKNIEAMVADVQALLKKGLAYEKDGSVYFAIEKFPGYGALAGLEKRNAAPAKHRVDADDYDKDAAEDFVLWKGWKEEDGEVYWETPLGKGRPGWHIECSAMIRRHLGDQIDVHTGAADLVFPHHTNEIAQAEGVTGKRPFVRFWFHRGFLTVDNEKMAKRIGNVLALSDVAKNELEALAFRWAIVSSHYRTPLNFTDQSMPAAKAALGRLLAAADRLEAWETKSAAADSAAVAVAIDAARKDFSAAMDDDLNTPAAAAAIFDAVKLAERPELSKGDALLVSEFLEEADAVFGVVAAGLPYWRAAVKRPLSAEEAATLEKWEEARTAKRYEEADALRVELKAQGIDVRNTPGGTVWQRDPWA
ncbi:cysteine--tRNA ligase [Patescibacteria group bacterium]|nr:MAG: cysteine--tRNA ligase [Patescibacteria group bacterium]